MSGRASTSPGTVTQFGDGRWRPEFSQLDRSQSRGGYLLRQTDTGRDLRRTQNTRTTSEPPDHETRPTHQTTSEWRRPGEGYHRRRTHQWTELRSAREQGDKETNKGSQGPIVGTLCIARCIRPICLRASEAARQGTDRFSPECVTPRTKQAPWRETSLPSSELDSTKTGLIKLTLWRGRTRSSWVLCS